MVSVYRTPTFNLTCNIWDGWTFGTPPIGPPSRTSACQLRIARTAFALTAWHTNLDFDPGVAMWLNLPKGTHIAGFYGLGTHGGAVVEVPAGSFRFYGVVAVDDVAKGFPNEYRVAMIAGFQSPEPIP